MLLLLVLVEACIQHDAWERTQGEHVRAGEGMRDMSNSAMGDAGERERQKDRKKEGGVMHEGGVCVVCCVVLCCVVLCCVCVCVCVCVCAWWVCGGVRLLHGRPLVTGWRRAESAVHPPSALRKG